MAYVRLAPLALFVLATSLMFPMKKIEAVTCSGWCSPFEVPPCRSLECRTCIYPTGLGTALKMIDEHPNLCQSHDECTKKGSGNFCARYPSPYVDYGWCFDSDSESLQGFLAMSARA
ncbi:hypothetical protein CR513_31866, partial [Mucuna pruriens]